MVMFYLALFIHLYLPLFKGECHVCGVDMKHPTHDEYNHGRPKLSRRIYCDSVGDDLFEEV
jgi:hypothetical protein